MIEERKIEISPETRRPRAKKEFSEHLNALMLTTVGFLLVFMFMAAMTRITVNAGVDFVEVGIQTLLMYICTVSIHIILRSYARRKGRETKRWVDAHREIERNGRAVVERGLMSRASEYCRAWEEEDINSVRQRILKEVGLTLEEYTVCAKYTVREVRKRFPAYTKEQLRALGRAKRVRRLHYDENYLSMRERVGAWRRAPSGGIKAETSIRLQTAQLLVTSALSSLYSVSLAAELITNFSFATVVMCLVKLAMLVLFATFGVIGGYRFATGREVAEMLDRADEQRRFFKWCGEPFPKEEKAEE